MSAAVARKALPQCGRAANGASAASRSTRTRATASGSRVHVKCRATLGRSVLRAHPQLVGGDGADLRDLEHGRSVSPSAWTARIAPSAWSRGTWNSDWISSPLLGVKPMRKCGRRSDHGPGTPSCGVQLTASRPRIGWRSTVAATRAEELVALLLGRVGDAALDPHLVDGLAPAREDADAVAAGGDLVEVLVQRVPAQPLEHALAHLVGGLDVEGDARHDAERSEADDDAVEVRLAARHGERARRRR